MNLTFTPKLFFFKILSPLSMLMLMLFLEISSYGQAGKGTISGTVKDSTGSPLPQTSVILKNTNYGTMTDLQGNFTLNVPAGKYKLLVQAMGYNQQEHEVDVSENQTSWVPSITLKETTNEPTTVVIEAGSKYRSSTASPSLRLQTPLLEVPQNIQVVTKEVLSNQQSFDMLEGVTRNVSGAQKVEHWDNYARINMRGAQLTAFRNGMNVSMPWGPLTEDLSMVERIEFVKGPAGFMLASGEPSGFYNVVTKKPTGYRKGEATFSLGSFETYRTTLDLDGKLSDNGKLLYRLNVMGQMKGSHRDYEYNNRYTIVPVIKYLLDEKSSITLEYTHQFSQMNVIGSNYAFSNRKYGELPVSFTTAEPNLKPTTINDKSMLVMFEHNFNEQWKITAQAAYFHYNQKGQSLWPWNFEASSDSLIQRGISIWDALGQNKSGQVFLNGKFSTGIISHKLLAGLDMKYNDYYADWSQGAALGRPFNIYAPQYGTIASTDIPQWDRSKDIRERGVRYNNSYNAVYIQDELGFFGNKLRLTLAARFTSTKNINPYSGNTEDGKFTPRAGLSYSLNKTTSAYLVYDQAFLPNPGMDWQKKSFDPITGNNLEGGLKRDWMNGKWSSTLSVYQITKNNVLTADLQHPDPSTGQFIYSKQTGQQQTRGVEFDLRGQLTRNLQIVCNYAYTDAKITKDSDPEVVGNQVAGATRHLQNTWLTYKFSNVLNGFMFNLGYQYQSGRSSWYVFNKNENSLPDYFRLDGGIGYQKDKFTINVLLNNILNSYLYSGAPSGGYYYWQTEPKRNIRLSVAYKF